MLTVEGEVEASSVHASQIERFLQGGVALLMLRAPPHAEADAVATEHHGGPLYGFTLEGWSNRFHTMRLVECSSFGVHHIAQEALLPSIDNIKTIPSCLCPIAVLGAVPHPPFPTIVEACPFIIRNGPHVTASRTFKLWA